MTLSKSDYMLYLRHPAWLWLKKFQKHKLPAIDENTQALFDAGHNFETYAEKLYPHATKLGFHNYNEYLSLPSKTKDALDNGAQTIFQGRFEADDLTCIVDVLDRVADEAYDLIEIKVGTKAKPEHIYDLAFQTLVLEKSGLKIRNILVMHVNKDYVRHGAIVPSDLVAKTDVTSDVKLLIDKTFHTIEEIKELLASTTESDLSPRLTNPMGISGTSWFGEWLTIYKTLNPDLAQYNIYDLSYPSEEQIGKLEEAGIKFIKDIPEELALRSKQIAQIKTTKSNKRILSKKKIKAFLDTFVYPLYFFDYETMSSAIPYFDGMSPYKDYSFQYSLHVLETPESEQKHYEYLHTENSNPIPELLKQLKQDIGETGTILTWNMGYEKGINDQMAEMYPEYREFLDKVNERIEDMMTPFAKMWFVDKDFFGSASLKNVLPILVPELSYKELDVSDGLLARRMWTETYLEGGNSTTKDKIRDNLIKYCTLDTYAMVRILSVLREIVTEVEMTLWDM